LKIATKWCGGYVGVPSVGQQVKDESKIDKRPLDQTRAGGAKGHFGNQKLLTGLHRLLEWAQFWEVGVT